MQDFFNTFWPYFITLFTLAGIIACLILLVLTSKMKVAGSGAAETSGHVWDEDITEMNNPLPRWWVWMFVLTILFSLGYLVVFPGIASYAGKIEWTSVNQYEVEVEKANEALKPIYAQFEGVPIADIADLPATQSIGERLYMNNCAQCHASDARGSRGFPNLTDGDWLHGGSPEKIEETITNGRHGMMPAMGAMIGSEADVRNLANYVLSLSNSSHDDAAAALGKEKFVTCAACHGANGEGNQAMGAPNLTDSIWLHGAGEAAITQRIMSGVNNQMPAQKDKLTPAQIKVLAAYIWGMSNPSEPE